MNVLKCLTQYLVGLQEVEVCLKPWPNHLFHSVIHLHHTGALGVVMPSQCRCSDDRLHKQQFVSSYQVWICPISTLKGSPEVCIGESVQDCGVHIMVRSCQVRCSVGRHNEQCWFKQAQPLGLL